MKKFIPLFITLAFSSTSIAQVDMSDMHKQLNIMNGIFKTSLNEVAGPSGAQVGRVDSLYLKDQGIVFTLQTGGHFSHWQGDDFAFISVPPAPVAPMIEHDIVIDDDVEEIIIRTMEATGHEYEKAIETMAQVREESRQLREQQRDVTFELRDVERDLREKKYQEKRIAEDKAALKELKAEIKALEKEQKALLEQREVLAEKNKKQAQARQAQKQEQQKKRMQYNAALHQQFAETLCAYGNSLKALPKDEKISLVVKRGGEQVNNRVLDKVIIFNKADMLDCVIDKVSAKQLLSKATQYSF
ncbi:hypothetical protein LP316_13880 [Thalassotalea sp. LPB0316]|uniref:hypothetical protein n=1 Tax=Thalassotalea sp. LPB0316 TaxID=2769490 RepID=UPI0018689051|nr:hypothetical protein [Thalassotalea sp. LPB0316]QOL25371.1 hypothetical protein LP316_13880 [Thalassotalea sp. LPB0316]